jgi:hypothetical protein
MTFLERMLKLAREHDAWSPEAKSFESNALTNIRTMISFWADEHTLRGDKMNGHNLVRWKKEVYSRIQELDKIFKEDDKIREEVRNAKK